MDKTLADALVLAGFIVGHFLLAIGAVINIAKPAARRLEGSITGKTGLVWSAQGKVALGLLALGSVLVLVCNALLPYPCANGALPCVECFSIGDYVLDLSGYLILIPTFFLPLVADVSGYEQQDTGSVIPSSSLDRVTYLFMFCGLALGVLNTYHLPEVPVLIDFIANIIAFMATSFALLGDTVEHNREEDAGPTGRFKRFTPVGLLVGAVALVGFLLSSSTLIYTNKEQDKLQQNIEAANEMLSTSVTPLIDKVNTTLGTSIKNSIAEIDQQSDSIAGKMAHIEQGFAVRVQGILNDPKNLIAQQNHYLNTIILKGQGQVAALKPSIDSMPLLQRRLARQTQLVREDLVDLEEDLPGRISQEVSKSPTIQALERSTRDLPSRADVADIKGDMLKRSELKPLLDAVAASNAEARKELAATQTSLRTMAVTLDRHFLLPKTRYRPGDTLLIDDNGDILLIGRDK